MRWYERKLKKLVCENVDRIALVQISDFKIGSTTSPDRSVIADGDIPLEQLLDLNQKPVSLCDSTVLSSSS